VFNNTFAFSNLLLAGKDIPDKEEGSFDKKVSQDINEYIREMRKFSKIPDKPKLTELDRPNSRLPQEEVDED